MMKKEANCGNNIVVKPFKVWYNMFNCLRPMRNYRVVKHLLGCSDTVREFETLTLRYKNKKDMGNSVKRR